MSNKTLISGKSENHLVVEVVTFCHGLELEAPDGKQRVTDCANAEGLFRPKTAK